VADYNLSLKDLIGMIKTFFNAIGIEELRFKPAFNPYTEPSMEVLGTRTQHALVCRLFSRA
jgi:phenylalanyl-tRNA synthetase alpha chain